MDLGFSELVVIFGIILLLVMLSAMAGGVGLRVIRQIKPAHVSPLEIAQARYARGEITREQFEELKRDLQNK